MMLGIKQIQNTCILLMFQVLLTHRVVQIIGLDKCGKMIVDYTDGKLFGHFLEVYIRDNVTAQMHGLVGPLYDHLFDNGIKVQVWLLALVP